MDIQEIEVLIAPDGQAQVRVQGVRGRDCLSLTEGLERLLGGEILAREMRPEADEDAQGVGWRVEQTQSLGGELW